MIFPDARAAVLELIDGSTHEFNGATYEVPGYYSQPSDENGQHVVSGPQAIIYRTGGQEGWIDRVDQITVDLFAPLGELAVKVLESIKDDITGENIETPEGFLDSVSVRTVPVDVPYGFGISLARATFDVVTRPL